MLSALMHWVFCRPALRPIRTNSEIELKGLVINITFIPWVLQTTSCSQSSEGGERKNEHSKKELGQIPSSPRRYNYNIL